MKSLKPGSYTITVKDKANSHNFHIFGPGVNKVVTTRAVRRHEEGHRHAQEGTYKFLCEPHAADMKGSFKVA